MAAVGASDARNGDSKVEEGQRQKRGKRLAKSGRVFRAFGDCVVRFPDWRLTLNRKNATGGSGDDDARAMIIHAVAADGL